MIKSPIRIEVLSLLIHAIIAIVILIGYVVALIATGHSDQTLQTVLVIAITSLFGTAAISMQSATNKANTQLPTPQVTPVETTPAPMVVSQTINNPSRPQAP